MVKMYKMGASEIELGGKYLTCHKESEPVDQRFMGSNPTPPSCDGVERTLTMEQLRKQWRL
jgi:hypothetical protein